MFTPNLDRLATVIAERMRLKEVPLARGDDNACIVATRFYASGGHSRVAGDICRLIGAEHMSIVLTDIYRHLRHHQLLGGPPADHPARSVALLSAPTLTEKILELYSLLAAIRPSRIFLIQNHMDMVAVAGVWPFRSVVEFVHHADHQPTLGATLPFAAHADLTYTCHGACRAAGLDPVWAGMTVDAAPTLAPAPLDGALRIATCGPAHKYRHPAAHRWSDFAVAALRRPDAEFLHVGPTDPELVEDVRQALVGAGIDPARYRFLGAVRDLSETLVAERANAYLGSYPDAGGKATLDSMAAGIAPVVPVAAEQGRLLHFDHPSPFWLRIERPEEVPDALERSRNLSQRLRSEAGQAQLRADFATFERYVRDV